MKKIFIKMLLVFALVFGIFTSHISLFTSNVYADTVTGNKIVAEAKKQLGKPYEWGAEGPSSFDCSGLVWYTHRQVGINFSRTTAAVLSTMGTPVAKNDLQPGDIITFRLNSSTPTTVSHVAIYIGNGQIIHAPTFNQPVQVANLNTAQLQSGYYNARRLFDGVPIATTNPLPNPINVVNEYIVMDMGGNLYAKKGIGDGWTLVNNGATKKVQVVGQQIFYIDSAGNFKVKTGLNGATVTLSNGVADFEVSGNLIVYRIGNNLYGKQAVNAVATLLSNSTSSVFHVSGERIGFIGTDRQLFMKEGFNAPWVTLTNNIDDFKMTPQKIVARSGNTLFGKEDIYAPWVNLAGGSSAKFDIENDRIVFINTSGTLVAKDGMGGSWVTLTNNANDFRLDGKKIIARVGDSLVGKDDMNASWATLVGGSSTKFGIENGRIMYIDGNGGLHIKESMYSTWTKLSTNVNNFGF